MTLLELIAQFRSDSDDAVAPYLSSDADVTLWFNEAEEEAALRSKLIYEAAQASICSIAITTPTARYRLNEAVIDIAVAHFTPTGETDPIALDLVDRIELDRIKPAWRTLTERPTHLIQDDKNCTLVPKPDISGTLSIECYRTPLSPMVGDDDEPEIHRLHHRNLVAWALYRAFDKPDSEVFDKNRSDSEYAKFERIFGKRPDANYRRDFQANRPHFNKSYF